MATKTGRSDGGAEPVKYLTGGWRVRGSVPEQAPFSWLDASGDQLTMLLLRFPRQHQKPRPTLTSTQSVCSQRAPKKRRVSLRPEVRSTSGRQPMTRPARVGSTELRSCSPGLAGPCSEARSLPEIFSNNL
jgi:hypothetical protein